MAIDWDALNEISMKMIEASERYDKECEDYWNRLSKEDRLKAFYSVCKRIHKGDIVERGSYRHVLYDTFGFGMEAYVVGMDCGYMEIHNRMVTDGNV